MIIEKVTAKKILASFGNETIEASLTFADRQKVFASVPAGLSAGKYEIPKVSPDIALFQIEEIDKLVSQKDWNQEALDREISSHGFGGNATLAVSAAFFKANSITASNSSKFPRLMVLLFEGGEHGNSANPKLTIQEFMILEDTITGAETLFFNLRNYLVENGVETLVGAEGGFSPEVFDNNAALATIKKVFPDRKVCLDAADCFQKGDVPDYDRIIADFNIASIEDPFSDEDWSRWSDFFARHGDQILIVGDDLTTTNPDRIQKAIDLKAINAVVIKPNQIGTISQAVAAVKIARQGGLKIIVSHRGEETDDTWIIDFALEVQADFVKFGGMDRGERIAKYNRLRELGMN